MQKELSSAPTPTKRRVDDGPSRLHKESSESIRISDRKKLPGSKEGKWIKMEQNPAYSKGEDEEEKSGR